MHRMQVELKEIDDIDLDTLFQHQRDPVAVQMAAFTVADADDRARFDARWHRIRSQPDICARAVWVAGVLAGMISIFAQDGKCELTYWIDRAQWGRGIASAALAQMLLLDRRRPLWARAASDNLASQRVLKKAGFTAVGHNIDWAHGRLALVAETIYQLS